MTYAKHPITIDFLTCHLRRIGLRWTKVGHNSGTKHREKSKHTVQTPQVYVTQLFIKSSLHRLYGVTHSLTYLRGVEWEKEEEEGDAQLDHISIVRRMLFLVDAFFLYVSNNTNRLHLNSIWIEARAQKRAINALPTQNDMLMGKQLNTTQIEHIRATNSQYSPNSWKNDPSHHHLSAS